MLRVPTQPSDDAQGSLVQASMVRVRLQDRSEGGEPARGEQRVLDLRTLHGASPDRRSHRRARVHDVVGCSRDFRGFVEGCHERIDATIAEDSKALLLLHSKVAEEAAHRNHEGWPVDAPLQQVDKHRDATALLQGASVTCSLGHQRQCCDRILQDVRVSLVLGQQLHDDRDCSQSVEDGVRALHYAKDREDLQAALDHRGVARVALEQRGERGQQPLLDCDVLVCRVLTQEPRQHLDDRPEALGGLEILMRSQP
mmetsp:Transcript_40405/g.104570  ORF Transcript_40405/g.104570 Transcript_40405/m.104570 type:complete len:255 (-) Transcript_40405:206-970(-)